MTAAPTISCLLVTTAGPRRDRFFRRSVADYCRQTYAPRELVIVSSEGSPADDAAMTAFIDSLGRDDIRLVRVPDGSTLGRKRNLSVAAARGDVLCTWDDDDRYHPLRLERQVRALLDSGREAVFLQEVLMYFAQPRTLHLTNWRQSEVGGMPASMMVVRTAPIDYPEIGPSASFGEDTEVAAQLRRRQPPCLLAEMAYLYVYFAHGYNTGSADHFDMLRDRLAVSQGLLRRREATIREGLRGYDALFGDGGVVVEGSNGPAFTLA